MKKCGKCFFENDNLAIYCQNCGSLLKKKINLKKFLKSLNFGSIAGTGSKGVSIAPLVGMELDKKNNTNIDERVTKSHCLKDGSWFCPYCGKKNVKFDFSCSNCLKSKP